MAEMSIRSLCNPVHHHKPVNVFAAGFPHHRLGIISDTLLVVR